LPSPRKIGADSAAGWRFTMRDPALRVLTAFSSLGNFIGTIGYIAIIPYLKRAFGAGDHVVGIAFGLFAGGAALGSLIAGRTRWPLGPAAIVSSAINTLVWIPLISTTSLVVAIASLVAGSIASGYYVTTIVSWRLRVIPEELVGRVFGVVRLVALIGVLPASILGGWCADHLGVRAAMAISVVGYAVLIVLLAASPAVRSERR
jgi:MFS family permease